VNQEKIRKKIEKKKETVQYAGNIVDQPSLRDKRRSGPAHHTGGQP
jgi:hypothetical protein